MNPMNHVFSYWLYCKYTMFYFLQKLLVITLKINLPSPLWNKNFLTCHNRFFTKILLPHFGRWDANFMTLPNQLAFKEITTLQNTTACDYRILIKHLSKDLSQRLKAWGLRKQGSIRKISNWVETDASAQSSF